MIRYRRIAERQLAIRMAGLKEPIKLYTVSCWADQAAREAGKVRDLYDSLWDYEQLLPDDWSVRMLQTRPGGDSLAMACPPGWKPGDSKSNELLSGVGALIEAKPGDLNL